MQWELQLFNYKSQTLVTLPVQNDDAWMGILNAHVDRWLGDAWTPITYLLRMRTPSALGTPVSAYLCDDDHPGVVLTKDGFVPYRADLIRRVHVNMRTFFLLKTHAHLCIHMDMSGTHTGSGTCVEIPEEDILILQKLEMARLEFERRMRRDTSPEDEITFSVVSDTRAEYVLDSGMGYPITLAHAQWDLLGVYDAQSWTWAWALLPPPDRSRANVVRDVACMRMPEFTAHGSIALSDPMLISYIQALLMQTFGYTHIHVQRGTGNAGSAFTAFGLRDVHWEPYDPEAHIAQLYYATLAGVRV